MIQQLAQDSASFVGGSAATIPDATRPGDEVQLMAASRIRAGCRRGPVAPPAGQAGVAIVARVGASRFPYRSSDRHEALTATEDEQ